jgi:hypothetical protein
LGWKITVLGCSWRRQGVVVVVGEAEAAAETEMVGEIQVVDYC